MSARRGIVFNIMRFSIHDGPGIRTTVFLKGCSLRCGWCHNPEGRSTEPIMVLRTHRCIVCGECVRGCEEGALEINGRTVAPLRGRCRLCGRCVDRCPAEARERIGQELSVDEVMAELVRDRPFYEESKGGATFSGGEPFEQPEFLEALLHSCKEAQIETAVDTVGAAEPRLLDRLTPYVDHFLIDLKLVDPQRHERAVGIPNGQILENLRRLTRQRRSVRVRIPIVPGINDDAENIEACGRFLSSLHEPPSVDLLPYHRAGESKWSLIERDSPHGPSARLSREDLEKIREHLRCHRLIVGIGG